MAVSFIMHILVLSSSDEISYLKPDEKIVHFSFRPTAKDIMTVYSKSPGLIAIQMPDSFIKNISSAIKMFLTMNNIKLIKGNLWGYRKDINPNFELKEVNEMISNMKQNEKDRKYIISQIEDKFNLSPELCSFLYDFYENQK